MSSATNDDTAARFALLEGDLPGVPLIHGAKRVPGVAYFDPSTLTVRVPVEADTPANHYVAPIEVDRCPVCKTPAHPSETGDDGLCMRCKVGASSEDVIDHLSLAIPPAAPRHAPSETDAMIAACTTLRETLGVTGFWVDYERAALYAPYVSHTVDVLVVLDPDGPRATQSITLTVGELYVWSYSVDIPYAAAPWDQAEWAFKHGRDLHSTWELFCMSWTRLVGYLRKYR